MLRVNKDGKRYSDKGFGTHILAATAGAKQPNGMLWGVFDSAITKQVEYQAPCHAVFDYTEPGRMEKLERTLEKARQAGASGTITTEYRPLYCADTLEELASCMFENKSDREAFWLRYSDTTSYATTEKTLILAKNPICSIR